MLHTVDASQNGETEWTFFHWTQLYLCIRRYPDFSRETIFVTGTGNRQMKIQLRSIYLALGDLTTQSLLSLHSFSGADITGTVA